MHTQPSGCKRKVPVEGPGVPASQRGGHGRRAGVDAPTARRSPWPWHSATQLPALLLPLCCWQGSCFPLALPGPDPVFRTRSLRSAPQRHCDRTGAAALAWTLPPLPPCLSPGAGGVCHGRECNRCHEGCHTPGLAHLVLCLISDP